MPSREFQAQRQSSPTQQQQLLVLARSVSEKIFILGTGVIILTVNHAVKSHSCEGAGSYSTYLLGSGSGNPRALHARTTYGIAYESPDLW